MKDDGDKNDPSLTFIKQPANTRKPFECRCLAKENPNPESQPVTRTALLPTYFRRSDPTLGTQDPKSIVTKQTSSGQ